MFNKIFKIKDDNTEYFKNYFITISFCHSFLFLLLISIILSIFLLPLKVLFILFTSLLLNVISIFLIKRNYHIEISQYLTLLALALPLMTVPIVTNNIQTIFFMILFPIFTIPIRKGEGIIISLVFLIISFVLFYFFTDFFKNEKSTIYINILFFVSSLIFIWIAYATISKIIKNQEDLLKEKEAQLKEKIDFLNKLSFQLRIPLNNLSIANTLIDRKKLPIEFIDYFDTIVASTNNIINIVDKIGKISESDIILSRGPITYFDFETLVINTVKIYSEQYKNAKINLNFEKKFNYYVIDYPIQIKQILLNILNNIFSIKPLSNQEIEMKISHDLSGNHYKITLYTIVKNINILEDSHGKCYYIFNEPVEDEEDRYLDFTFAKKILENYNSKLFIENFEDKVIISFTINVKADISKSKEPIKENIFDLEQFTTKKVKLKDASILLVEDNPINQKIVILGLKKFVKDIDVANNGKEALEKIVTKKYDLILMDVQMPIMSGITVTKKIRELELSTNTNVPIIAITAYAVSGDKEACLAAGMNDYISKPFQMDELIDKMKKLLGDED